MKNRMLRTFGATMLMLALVSCGPTTMIIAGGAAAAGGVIAMITGGDDGGGISAPGKAKNPTPADNASEVALFQQLSWGKAKYASYYQVYFGTSATPGLADNNVTGETYDPGRLDGATTYYWRVDAFNSKGNSTGDLWTFSTYSGPLENVTYVSPADGTGNLSLTTELVWQEANGAESYTLYFGTTIPPAQECAGLTTTTYAPTLAYDTSYYWRVDSVNSTSTETGAVWSFKTAEQLPGVAVGPSPADGENNVFLDADLSWTSSARADGYEVYLGKSNPPTTLLCGSLTTASIDPGALDNGATYYWYVVAYNTAGAVSGNVWTFHTINGFTIVTESLPATLQYDNYSETLSAGGGASPYTWGNSGALPPGLSLDGNSGVISGNATTVGSYSFTILANDSSATPMSDSKGFTIDVVAPVTAEFTADCTSGIAPLTVTFTDCSSGTPTAWMWDFGDGGNSTSQNPSHEYSTPGTYAVTLTVSNQASNDSETKTDYVYVDYAGRPYVESTVPADNAGDVAVSSTISATFSESMNESTINAATFRVLPSVAGTISYDDGTYAATFTPSGQLSISTTYTVTIRKEVEDASGLDMKDDYTWTFTTTGPDLDNSVFVDADYAGGSNDGTMARPFTTIQTGVENATDGRPVLVASGTYSESVTVSHGVEVYGGYNSSDSWASRTPKSSVINATGDVAVAMTDVAGAVTFDGFEVNGGPTTGATTDGFNVTNCPLVSIVLCDVYGGSSTNNARGIYATTGSVVTVSSSEILGGNDATNAFGVYAIDSSTVTLSQTTVTGGEGSTFNLGVYAENLSTLDLDNCTVVGSVTGATGDGRGLYLDAGSAATAAECVIKGGEVSDTAYYGIYALDNSAATVTYSEITDTVRPREPGSFVTIRHSSLTATTTDARAVSVRTDGGFMLDNCVISGCVYLDGPDSACTMSDSTVTSSRTDGSVYVEDGDLAVSGCTITATGNAPAVYAFSSSNVSVTGSTLLGCGTDEPIAHQADWDAVLDLVNNTIMGTNIYGVYYEYNGTTGSLVGNVIIPGNSTTDDVVAVVCSRSIPITNNYIYSGNSSEISLCIWVHSGPASPVITNNTLRCAPHPSMTFTAGVSMFDDVTPKITNNVFYCENASGVDRYAIREVSNDTDPSTIENNLFNGWSVIYRDENNFDYTSVTDMETWTVITGTTTAENNLSGDPDFTNSGCHLMGYRIGSASDCIDAGLDASGAAYGSVSTDIEGGSRPQGSAYDVGCQERE